MNMYLAILLFPFPSSIVPFSLNRNWSVMMFATATASQKKQ